MSQPRRPKAPTLTARRTAIERALRDADRPVYERLVKTLAFLATSTGAFTQGEAS